MLLDSSGLIQSSFIHTEEVRVIILPMQQTRQAPTEVGIAEKPLPSTQKRASSGNVHSPELTPVKSDSVVRMIYLRTYRLENFHPK